MANGQLQHLRQQILFTGLMLKALFLSTTHLLTNALVMLNLRKMANVFGFQLKLAERLVSLMLLTKVK